MVEWQRTLILLAIGAGCVMVLIWASNGATTDIRRMNAETLERAVRRALPMGSSLAAVEDYLGKHGLQFSFQDRSKTVFAIARKLKGGTSLVSKSLAFKFHFDDALALKSIDAEVLYTGP